MKANELMIGDWVLDIEFDRNHKARIDTIENTRVWLDTNSTYTPIRYIEHIPLTAEILEKNGFKRIIPNYDKEMRCECWDCEGTDWVVFQNSPFMFCRCEDWVGFGIDIKYVHELQHALRLCGVGKEIVL